MNDCPTPIWISLLSFLSLILLHYPASAQPGFISINCGGQGTTAYTDTSTGIIWQPDGEFMTIGSTATITDPNLLGSGITSKELTTLRYFADPTINKFCYSLGPLNIGDFYLVRASFLHGNYDGKNELSVSFDLLLEGDIWDSIAVSNTSAKIKKEIYIEARRGNVSVCVASNSGTDTPFISSIEVRRLYPDMVATGAMKETNRLMHMSRRYNFGALTADDIRYPFDKFDRIWYARTNTPRATTNNSISLQYNESPPELVMQTALLSPDNISLGFTFSGLPIGTYIATFYMAEIETGVEIGDRVFDGYRDDELIWGPIDIKNETNSSFTNYGFYYNDIDILNSTMTIVFKAVNGSRLGPLWSAFELLRYSNMEPNATTLVNDVDALSTAKMSLGLSNSTGDPCLPLEYPYPWVTCSITSPPRVTSLLLPNKNLQGNLPSSINLMSALTEINFENNHLFGEIPDWSALSKLKILKLGNNNLSGPIPEFLGNLPSLLELSLQYNNFNGEIPKNLQQKNSSSILKLNVVGNPNLCLNKCTPTPSPSSSPSPDNPFQPRPKPTEIDSMKIVIIVGAGLGFILICIIIAIMVLCFGNCKNPKPTTNDSQQPVRQRSLPLAARRVHGASPLSSNVQPQEDIETTNLEVTLEELEATNCFRNEIGKGSFGPIYHGRRNRIDIAVKVLEKIYYDGDRQLNEKVQSLTTIHHENLVPLVGYCVTEQLALVYKYMFNKSLRDQLDGTGGCLMPPTWKERLCIVLDAAQGLHYLHTRVPIIIHGNVKSSNILIDEGMKGRFGDFGLSRFYNIDEYTTQIQMSSKGYFDPLLPRTKRLDVINDVYSFGVVLMEIITGQKAYDHNRIKDRAESLADWVSKKYKGAESVEKWMDQRLKMTDAQIMDTISMVLILAIKCVRRHTPSMDEVMKELTCALQIENTKPSPGANTMVIPIVDPKPK